MILSNTVYRTVTISKSQHGQCMVRIVYTVYANRTAPYRKIYRYVECLRIILKWTSTVPIRTIPYRTGCTCIVPYRTEIKLIRYLRDDRGETAIYHTVRFRTVRHRGRYVGACCTVPSDCAGIYMLRRLFGRRNSVSDDPVCKVVMGSWSFIWPIFLVVNN